jgi:hypothetical protein
MPNPYHDADGKFASRDELNNNIQQALDDGRIDDYIRERKNLDDIEREIAASKGELWKDDDDINEDPYEGYIENNISHLWRSPDQVWAKHEEQYPTYDISHIKIIGGQVSPNMAGDFDPYKDSWDGRSIPGETLDLYAAKGTPEGVKMLEDYASFKSIMSDSSPLQATGAEYTVYESDLAYTQAAAAKDHAQQMSFIEEDLKASVSMEATANQAIGRLQAVREENARGLKKSQFELAYVLSQAKNAESWEANEDKATNLVDNIQRHHDEIIYSHVQERQLKKFL